MPGRRAQFRLRNDDGHGQSSTDQGSRRTASQSPMRHVHRCGSPRVQADCKRPTAPRRLPIAAFRHDAMTKIRTSLDAVRAEDYKIEPLISKPFASRLSVDFARGSFAEWFVCAAIGELPVGPRLRTHPPFPACDWSPTATRYTSRPRPPALLPGSPALVGRRACLATGGLPDSAGFRSGHGPLVFAPPSSTEARATRTLGR